MGKFIDLTGLRFGRLTVMKENGRAKNGKVLWLCLCDCGNRHTASGDRLRRGETQSCGCLRRERTARQFQKYAHGQVNPRIYRIWKLLRRRCYSNSNPKYKNYGARGIAVCPEWMNDYLLFQAWALENGYQDNLSIDRIDVNGPYSPENCRWTNNLIQCNNKTDNVFLEYHGERHTVADWARIKGIHSNTLYSRLRYGWSVEDTLEIPVGTRFKNKHKK